MSKLLEQSLVRSTRRHHALEHATIHILNRRHPTVQFVGWSTNKGFFVRGPVSPDMIHSAVTEAVARLRRGETHLAIHPQCGTNLVTAGLLVGLVAFVTMLPGSKRSRRERLPTVMLLSMLATLAAQPLGLWMQAYVTTDPHLSADLSPQIETLVAGDTPIYHVRLVDR
jgi:hypothetical protein